MNRSSDSSIERRALELFADLLELSGSERASRLREIHERDRALACELDALLDCLDDAAQAFPDEGRVELRVESSAEFTDIGPLSPTPAPSALPDVLGYEVLDRIGRGGQGVVYRARQVSTARIVAIKVFPSLFDAGSKRRGRFDREIELASQLRHPNVVTVYDSGSSSTGLPFLAMALIDGERLDDYLRRKAQSEAGGTVGVSPELALKLFFPIADAVAHAHQQGVLHRDLKPSNILVDSDDRPYLLDFGLARAIDSSDEADDGALTFPGIFMGTRAYASPEQRAGRWHEVDVQSDVYSLGVILFEMLTGVPPHAHDDNDSDSDSSARRRLVPSSGNPAVESDLDAVVLRATSHSKERRYRDTRALIDDLERYRSGLPIEAKRGQRVYIAKKWIRRHWLAASVASVIVLMAVVGAAVLETINARITRDTHEKSLLLGLRQSRLGDTIAEETLLRLLTDVRADTQFERRIRWAMREHTHHNPWLAAFDAAPGKPLGVAAATMKPRVVVWPHEGCEIQVFSARSALQPIGRRIRTDKPISSVRITPDGQTLFVALATGRILTYLVGDTPGDSTAAEFRQELLSPSDRTPVYLLLSPDGRWVCVRDQTAAAHQTVTLFHRESGSEHWHDSARRLFGGLAFSTDSEQFAFAADSVHVLEVDSLRCNEIPPPDTWDWRGAPVVAVRWEFFQPIWISRSELIVRWSAEVPRLGKEVRWLRWSVENGEVVVFEKAAIKDIHSLHPRDVRRAYSRDRGQIHELAVDPAEMCLVRRRPLSFSGPRITSGPTFINKGDVAAVGYANGELRLLDTQPSALDVSIGDVSTIHHIEVIKGSDLVALGVANRDRHAGEIVVYNVRERRVHSRTSAHELATTCVRVRGDRVISTGHDGCLKEWIFGGRYGEPLEFLRSIESDHIDPVRIAKPDEAAWCDFAPGMPGQYILAYASAGVVAVPETQDTVRPITALIRGQNGWDPTFCSSFAVDSENDLVYIGLKNSHGGGVQLVDLAAPTVDLGVFWIDAAVYDVAMEPTDRRPGTSPELALACSDGRVRIVNPARKKVTQVLVGHTGTVYAVTYARIDGRVLLVSGGSNGEIIVWDPTGGELIARLDDRGADRGDRIVLSVVFDEDQKRLFAGGSHNDLRVFDLDRLDLRTSNMAAYWRARAAKAAGVMTAEAK